MKKLLAIVLALTTIILCGCNKQVIDLEFHYDRAIISLPDGTVIDGAVESWRDYADGDQIQVKIDGTIYLIHSSDIVLIDGDK